MHRALHHWEVRVEPSSFAGQKNSFRMIKFLRMFWLLFGDFAFDRLYFLKCVDKFSARGYCIYKNQVSFRGLNARNRRTVWTNFRKRNWFTRVFRMLELSLTKRPQWEFTFAVLCDRIVNGFQGFQTSVAMTVLYQNVPGRIEPTQNLEGLFCPRFSAKSAKSYKSESYKIGKGRSSLQRLKTGKPLLLGPLEKNPPRSCHPF